MKTAVVLSAGAPHSSLMAGALCALYRECRLDGRLRNGRLFDTFYTSGAGALIGLLLAAPTTPDPEVALRRVLELAVADPIYNLLPVNYKVFRKPGPFTRPMAHLADSLKLMTGNSRLGNDLIDLWAAICTPTTLTGLSPGLCDPLPFLEELVDFQKLADVEFFLNFVVPRDPDAAQRLLRSRQIEPTHIRAAFSYPFLYRPVSLNGQLAWEGANWEPICFGDLDTRDGAAFRTVVLIDILTILERFVMRPPRSLWDAFGLTIMQPVVMRAKQDLMRFEERIDPTTGRHRDLGFTYRKVVFDLRDADGRHILDWSYSNMARMFELGLEAGTRFYRQYRDDL